MSEKDHDELLNDFGKRIRDLRKSMGLSQEALADACGLDRTYIAGIERGERNVSLRNIRIIANSLEITISDLMKGIE